MFRMLRRYREKGASAVEFAIVLPLLLTLVFGIMESGWMFAQFVEVRNAAREGARLAVVDFPNSGDDESDGFADIVSETCRRAQLSADRATVTLGKEGSGTSEAAVVTIDQDYASLTGFFDSLFNGTISSQAVMRIEREAVHWSTGSQGCSP